MNEIQVIKRNNRNRLRENIVGSNKEIQKTFIRIRQLKKELMEKKR